MLLFLIQKPSFNLVWFSSSIADICCCSCCFVVECVFVFVIIVVVSVIIIIIISSLVEIGSVIANIYLLLLLFLFCCWWCEWWWCRYFVVVLSQKPSIKSLVKIGSVNKTLLLLLYYCCCCCSCCCCLYGCCWSQKPTFKVWLKSGQEQLRYWWHWVCGGGGWWSKVIFLSHPTFELRLSWGCDTYFSVWFFPKKLLINFFWIDFFQKFINQLFFSSVYLKN